MLKLARQTELRLHSPPHHNLIEALSEDLRREYMSFSLPGGT
jgi:hypothetical protein